MEFGTGQILDFVREHTNAQAQLAGNSIHVDFLFLKKYMPRLAEHMHYRLVDVTTVVELARRWYPNVHRKAPRKKVPYLQTPLPLRLPHLAARVSVPAMVNKGMDGLRRIKTMSLLGGWEVGKDLMRDCGDVVR